jgi:hypothetical protein
MLWDILLVMTQGTRLQIQPTNSHSPSGPGNLVKNRSPQRKGGHLGQEYLSPYISSDGPRLTVSISWNSSRPCVYESNADMSS